MIERNVVRVETLDGMGTGLLYPCCCEERQGYIIFTNRHILENISDMEQIEEAVQITLYDDFGKEISHTKMKAWDCYWNTHSLRDQDDIAAIYFELEEDVVFHLETAVEIGELDNRTRLYMEGYPGGMSNDDRNSRLQLEGISKFLFPTNKEIGAYQITDDYHWYNNYSDYKILAGISGSPVYYHKQGRNYILGMNQSVSNINQGENPFKLVYYIKFQHILEYLRMENCIIFSKISECEFQILWIKKKIKKTDNEIKLLLLGGSGSGKTSFVKSFAYHHNEIKGVGDGQTTRSDVSYSFQLVNDEPSAKVLFLKMEEFKKRMNDHIGTKPIRMVYAQALGIFTDVVEDEEAFLVLLYGIYEQFAQLEEKHNSIQKSGCKKIQDCKKICNLIKELWFHAETVSDKIVMYEDILDHMLHLVPYYFIPCILDKGWRKEHALTDDSSNDKLQFLGIPHTEKRVDDIWKILADEVYKILENNQKNHFEILQKDLISFFYGCYVLKEQNVGIFEDKYKACYDALREKNITFEQMKNILHRCSHTEFEIRLTNKEFQEKLFSNILHVKGFFEAEEFDFLLGGTWTDEIEIGDEEKKEKIGKETLIEFRTSNEETDKKIKKDIVLSKGINTLLGGIYTKIMGVLKTDSAYKESAFYLSLNAMKEKDILLLQKCLMVTKYGSYTGIVKTVIIQDKISDCYASILNKLEIDTLTIVDTCGLDHVTVWNEKNLQKQIEQLYTNYVKEWESASETKQDVIKETGILYIKKLDSGKPDELQAILPIIRKTIPSTPMYCMFSGIDIFYRTEAEIEHILWKTGSVNCPKAVRYILENDMGMQDITDVNAYKVLKNNLLPFCGDERLVRNKFAYYKNNVEAVRKLLTSIAMKESSSMKIIDMSFVENISEEKIKEIINTMFALASLQFRQIWWNTKQADIQSFFKRKKLGYNGMYNHMWYYLFHEGYVGAIRQKGNILFEKTDESEKEIHKAAVLASLYNMENEFLGINDNLIAKDPEEEKNEFRKIIEEMYKHSKYNPFSDNYEAAISDLNKEKRDEIFDEVFNFTKHLNETAETDRSGKMITFCDKIAELFMKKFKCQVKNDNRRKVTYLIKMNETFMEGLKNIKKEFDEKYGDGISGENKHDSNNKKMFEEFMRYYFSNSEDEKDD